MTDDRPQVSRTPADTAPDSAAIRSSKPNVIMTMIGLVGVLLTALVSWTAYRIDHNTEQRLLQLQTRQAAGVISGAVVGIIEPLRIALDTATATHADAGQFARSMAAQTGPGKLFVTASLWSASTASPTTSLGAPPAMVADTDAAHRFIQRALDSPTFVVTSVSSGDLHRIGYALASPDSPRYVVYAERTIPANRRVAVENDSAFADLHFATYLGSAIRTPALQTTDVAPAQLPLRGHTSVERIPFGDNTITLVTSPAQHLGASLGEQLPWIFLAAGLVITVGSAWAAGQLVRRRHNAELDTAKISDLYEKLDRLYADQRTISETLQHALLPQSNPDIPNLEVASRYVAGAHGVDIGGDWYSLVRLDETHFAFVVGDISGRGVEAAALMARIRFTLRAYLLEGHPPDVALSMCSQQLDIEADGHIATVLVGTGDLTTREITLASAGHLSPLVVSAGRSSFLETTTGLPLGVRPTVYTPTTTVMDEGSMLVAFTDGLVERRSEDLAIGLQRLADAAAVAHGTVDARVAAVLSALTDNDSEDDIAMLAFEWTAVPVR